MERLGWLINRLRKTDIMFNKKKKTPICCKYHNTGKCHSKCKLKKSYFKMDAKTDRRYNKFMREAQWELQRLELSDSDEPEPEAADDEQEKDLSQT